MMISDSLPITGAERVVLHGRALLDEGDGEVQSASSRGVGLRGESVSFRVVSMSCSFPSRVTPIPGTFVAERISAVNRWTRAACTVIAPTPYFPPINIHRRWYIHAIQPVRDCVKGVCVIRPRFLHIPRVGIIHQARAIAQAAAPLVAGLARTGLPCILDAHFVYPTGAAAARLARRYGLPLVITGRGEDIIEMVEHPLLRREITTALCTADAAIAVSHDIGYRMRRLVGERVPVYVIPNGVDTARFAPRDPRMARCQLGLPQGGRLVVTVGYRIALKGHDIVIRALARLVRAGQDVALCIVGGQASWEPDTLPLLERVAREEGVRERVIFAGAQPPEALPLWYGAGDVFCLATRREGCPNVVLEALACGRPVVATAVGEIPRLVQDGVNGFVVPERSVEAFAAALERALQQRWSAQEVRSTIVARTWRSVALEVESVFLDVLRRRGRRLNGKPAGATEI